MRHKGTYGEYRYEIFFGHNAFVDLQGAVGNLGSYEPEDQFARASWPDSWRSVAVQISEAFRTDESACVVVLTFDDRLYGNKWCPYTTLYLVSPRLPGRANARFLVSDFAHLCSVRTQAQAMITGNVIVTDRARTVVENDLECLMRIRPLEKAVRRFSGMIGQHRVSPGQRHRINPAPVQVGRWVHG